MHELIIKYENPTSKNNAHAGEHITIDRVPNIGEWISFTDGLCREVVNVISLYRSGHWRYVVVLGDKLEWTMHARSV